MFQGFSSENSLRNYEKLIQWLLINTSRQLQMLKKDQTETLLLLKQRTFLFKIQKKIENLNPKVTIDTCDIKCFFSNTDDEGKKCHVDTVLF